MSPFSKVGAVCKPCAEAEPPHQEEAARAQKQTCKGAQWALFSCKSHTACTSHSFLLLFHVWGCRAPEGAPALYKQLPEVLLAHPGLQQTSEAVTLEKHGRHTHVFTHGFFPLHADTHIHIPKPMLAQPQLLFSLGLYLCLLACPVAEQKEMVLEGGFAAREYNPSASPPQSQPYDCWDC